LKTLILGGVKSGKSHQAEKLAVATDQPITFIATALAHDAEMSSRIKQHKADRPSNWTLVEEAYELGAVINNTCQTGHCVIVDCLTLWLTQLNSMGVIPMGELSRRYCDEAGLMHQRIASHCDRVILSVAGIAMTLKEPPSHP